jgi:hypothetical protein
MNRGLFGTAPGLTIGPGLPALTEQFCRVTNTATQSMTSGTYLTLTWISPVLNYYENPSAMWGLSNPTRITALEPGLHTFGFSCMMAANTTGDRYARFLRNGSASTTDLPTVTYKATTAEFGLSLTHTMWLDGGDYIEVQTKQDSGGALNVTVATAQPQFWMYRI